jgi:hypothetical protein
LKAFRSVQKKFSGVPRELRRSSLFFAVTVLAVTAFFAALLAAYHVGAYAGVDENGYIMTAKRLATTGDSAKFTVDPYEFVSGNWVVADNGAYYAKYPLGYPLLCALAYNLGGPSAVFLVNPILAALAVAGVFLLGAALINPFAGALAAILLATNPLHAYFGLSALSHSGSICFAVWGMFFLWRWAQRGGWWNAVLAGALTAYASTVRYTEGLLLLPIAAMVAWRLWSASGDKTEPRCACRLQVVAQVLVMAVAALVAAAPLLIHHWLAYGSPLASGYGLCGESTGFGWKWFAKNWPLTLSRMDNGGLMLIFPLGLVGLLYLAVNDAKRALFLGLWAVPPLLVYSAYYWAPQGEGPGFVRFFVSIFPPLILSGIALLCFAVQTRAWGKVAVGLFVLLVAMTNLREAGRQLEPQSNRLLFARQTSDVVRENLPADTVIVASKRVLEFVEFAGDYRLYAQETFERGAITQARRTLEDDGPRPFQRQKAAQLLETLGTKTDAQLAEMQRGLLSKHLAAGRTVALIAARDAFQRGRARLGDKFQFEPLAEWTETQLAPNDTVRHTPWLLYKVTPRAKAAPVTGTLAEQISALESRLRSAQTEFDRRHPGAQQALDNIKELRNELRGLQEQQKRARR